MCYSLCFWLYICKYVIHAVVSIVCLNKGCAKYYLNQNEVIAPVYC